MADDFDPSPRPSKRRKTYASGRTILKSSDGHGAFSGVSSALSSLSNRLLGRKKPELKQELHDDSAYGSEEDSFNEDDVVVTEVTVDAVTEPVSAEQDENSTVPGRRTRRSLRKSVEVDEASQKKIPIARKRRPEAVQKPGRSNEQNSNDDTVGGNGPEYSGGRRRSARKSTVAEAQSSAPQEEEENTSPAVQSIKSKKRKSKAETLETDTSEPVEPLRVGEADTSQSSDKLDDGANEETSEIQSTLR